MHLTEQERTIIATRVAALEARSGTQVVTAVVGRSDSYPEAPWKAFALGAAAAALACVIWQLAVRGWPADTPQTGHVLVILASGALLALLTILHPPFARPFVDRIRREVEATQFAQALFFRRGLDRTRRRVGILLLVSLFERKVVILADEGFDGSIDAHDWAALTGRITYLLRHSTTAIALRAGLDAMEAMLLERGFAGSGTANELPDAPLEPKDDR
jgi:putative membrane protein